MSSLLGKPKTQTQTSTTTVDLPGYVRRPLTDMMNRAWDLSQQEYQGYEGQRQAGYNPDELQAMQLTRDMVGQSQADLAQSQAITGEVANRGLNGFSQQQLQQYMNPYIENVLDVNKRRQIESYDQQRNSMMQNQGAIGAFGGSRTGLAEANLSKNFQQQLSDFDQQGLYSSYNEGMGRAMQGTQLAGQASMDLANLARSQQQSGYMDIAALQQQGLMQRGYDQQGLDINYQDFLMEKAYPYEQLQFLGGLALPTAQATAGSTNTQVSKQTG